MKWRHSNLYKRRAESVNLRAVAGALNSGQASNAESSRLSFRSNDSSLLRASVLSPPRGIGLWEHRFNLAIALAILTNIVMLALEMDWGPPGDASVERRVGWIVSECLVTLIFLVEICIRMYWERWCWVRSMWNWFDVVIVMSAVIDVWMFSFSSGKKGIQMLTILRVVRLLRLIRIVKLVRTLQGLYGLMLGIWAAIKNLCFICTVMVFGLLLYSIIATDLIGRNTAFNNVSIDGDTAYDRFGTVYRSMYSLFELMTLEGWDRVARPLVEEQPAMIIFVTSFIALFTIGMLNVMVALGVEATFEQTAQVRALEEENKRETLTKDVMQLHAVFDHANVDDSGGTFTLLELKNALGKNKVLRSTIVKMGVPIEYICELFAMLDYNSTGEVPVSKFVEGLVKLCAPSPSVWDSVATCSNLRRLLENIANLKERMDGIEKRIIAQDHMLHDAMAASYQVVDLA